MSEIRKKIRDKIKTISGFGTITRPDIENLLQLIDSQAKEIERLSAITEISTEALEKYSEMIVIDMEDRPQDVGQVAREAIHQMSFVKGFVKGKGETT